jgi:hypothetical protein
MARNVDPRIAHYRSKKAALSRSRPADDPELVEAGENLARARLERAIERALESAPPLTDEQVHRIAALLHRGVA